MNKKKHEANSAPVSTRVEPEGALRNHGKNILVVDDEKSQREILEMILTDEGYVVATAPSGEAALSMAKKQPFDLILTDLKMSGIDGIDLLKKLFVYDPYLPCIMLTAHGSVESVKKALRHGAFDF